MLASAAAAIAVTLSSATAHPDAQVRVDVLGLHAPSALVVLHGGIARRGRWFHWVPLLSLGGGRWTAVLQTPGFYGVYPVRVRVNGIVHPTDQTLQVVPEGFAGRPGFKTPEQVANWWAWIVAGVSVTTVSTWSTGFYAHRDRSFNRLLKVRFTLFRHPGTTYVSVARTRPGAPWRLLQVVSSP